MSDYKNAKVDMTEITEGHISIMLQTMADMLAEKYAPGVEPVLNLKKE